MTPLPHQDTLAVAYLRHELRMGMGFGPRTVRRRRAERHARAVEDQLRHMRYLRPWYHDAPGTFGPYADPLVAGHEKPYWPSRHWARCMWSIMRNAFWAAVHDAMGTVDETREYPRNAFAVISGLTA